MDRSFNLIDEVNKPVSVFTMHTLTLYPGLTQAEWSKGLEGISLMYRENWEQRWRQGSVVHEDKMA